MRQEKKAFYKNRFTILHDQVKSKVLNKEGAIVPDSLAIQGVQESMASTISDSAASVELFESIFEL